MDMAGVPALISQIVAVGAILAVAFATLWLAIWFVRIIILKLPEWVTGPHAPKLLAAIVALLMLPAVAQYLVRVVGNLFNILPGAGADLAEWVAGAPSACSDNCLTGILGVFGEGISSIVWRTVNAVQLNAFPTVDFLWFLVALTLLAMLFSYIRDRALQTHEADAPLAQQGSAVINLTFLGIVGLSFYLSLSSLLAIPLMQTQTVAQGFSVEDLDKALTTAVPTQAELDQRFPETTFELSNAVSQAIVPSDEEQRIISEMTTSAATLVEVLSTARNAALAEIAGLKSRGADAFKSQNAQRLGGRETVEHYAAILRWAQDERRRVERQFSSCLQAARGALRNARGLVETIQSSPPANVVAAEPVGVDPGIISRYFTTRSEIENASQRCDIAQTGTAQLIPARPSRSASLKTIGQWTEWLLGTESMPLVIIVGLIGFSLLGATMSRIVRVGANRGLDGLSLADVLKVVAGGVAAAMVVFLASYGGLAVLGETQADPSPYVVFAFCLVGAVFSEDVWEWARTRFRLNGNGDNGGNAGGDGDNGNPPDGAAPAADPPVSPPVADPPPGPVSPLPQGPAHRGRRPAPGG